VRRAARDDQRIHALHGTVKSPHARAIEALDSGESRVRQGPQHGLTDFTEPEDGDRRVSRHGREPLQHQRLNATRAALWSAARAVQRCGHAPGCEAATYRAGRARARARRT
jgi:hypothetical protein